MEKESDPMKTLGQAIDEIIRALQPLDGTSRITAVRASCQHLNIPLAGRTEENRRSEESGLLGNRSSSLPTDVRSLKEQKKPSTATEMAALVAFYLAELAAEQDRKPEVTVDDMIKYFKQAGFPLPHSTKDILNKAKNAGYFDAAERGRFKLNPVGYNLVAHSLPRSESGTGMRLGRIRKPRKQSIRNRGAARRIRK